MGPTFHSVTFGYDDAGGIHPPQRDFEGVALVAWTSGPPCAVSPDKKAYWFNCCIIVGTSMKVYPAAGLVGLAPRDAQIYYVDPKPSINYELSLIPNLHIIPERATTGIRMLVDQLLG